MMELQWKDNVKAQILFLMKHNPNLIFKNKYYNCISEKA
jgi:hypothetical protein